jgi:glutamine amidotransferase-like protein
MEMFTSMLQFDSIRGPDSTGVFGITKGNHVDLLKGDTDGYVFTQCNEYKKFEKKINSAYSIVIGHNRKATIGAIKPENAHPFRSDNIILVHNGSLRNAASLNKEVEVDSAAIASALAAHDSQKALSLLDGPFAIVWYDTNLKTLNIARNSGRPLVLLEYADAWIISSEAGLPLWLNGRESRKHNAILEVPVGKILTWSLHKLEVAPTEAAFNEFKWVAPASVSYIDRHTTQPHTALPGVPLSGTPVWPHAFGTGAAGQRQLSSAGDILDAESVEEDPSIQAGDEIMVKFDDSKDESGTTTFLGHPIIKGILDENVVVRLIKRTPKDANEFTQLLASHDHFKTRVQACGVYRGVPMLYVMDAVPVPTMFRSANGTFFTSDSLAPILRATNCESCMFSIFPHQVSQSIIRKKKRENHWTILCPKCIEKQVTHAVPKTTAAANEPAIPGGADVVH